jgi:ferredoxin
MSIVIIEHKCPQNHACPSVRVCPEKALRQSGHAAPKVDHDKCTLCGKCVRFCPRGALAVQA